MKTEAPVYLAGARGLLAGEFLRLLEAHPSLRLAGAYSRGGEGSLTDCHPQLRTSDRLRAMDGLAGDLSAALARGSAALVLALNHGESAPAWSALQAALGSAADQLTVIDLSADYRLPAGDDPEPWTYGLPELHAVASGGGPDL